MSTVIKNWDNKTWLSSNKYIQSFNRFLLTQIKLDKNSRILDIGCGRGKIIGSLSSKTQFKNKPIGIDIVHHKDKDKRIEFRKIDALTFFLNNKKKFDLILIKQTIHLLTIRDIKKLIINCKKNLSSKGAILVFSLDPKKNQLPTFNKMQRELKKSLLKDIRILRLLLQLSSIKISKKFVYEVKITKKEYLKMLKMRFISTLLSMSNKDLSNGIKEINSKYKNILKFNDNLICITVK